MKTLSIKFYLTLILKIIKLGQRSWVPEAKLDIELSSKLSVDIQDVWRLLMMLICQKGIFLRPVSSQLYNIYNNFETKFFSDITLRIDWLFSGWCS